MLSPRARRHLLLVVLVLLALTLGKRSGHRYDFCTYYTSGLLLGEGVPERAYDWRAVTERHRELHDRPVRAGAFLYSPLYLLVARGFTLVPFRTAEALHHLLTLAALTTLFWLLLQRARGPGIEGLLLLTVLASDVVRAQFRYQNWSFLLALLVALAWHFGRGGRRLGEVIAWSLAIHLKVLAALALLSQLVARRRRLILRVVVASLALAVLTLPIVGARTWVSYCGSLASIASGGIRPFHNKVSLQATLARFLTEPMEWLRPTGVVDDPLLPWLFPLSLPLLMALLWRSRRDWEHSLALTIPYLLLFVPQIWDHTQILLLLVIPSLGGLAATLVALALSAGWFYPDVLWHLFLGVVRDGEPGTWARLALLYYPLIDLGVLVALARRGPASIPGRSS